MGSQELGGICRMNGVAGGTAQGPSRERVCRVSGGEQGQNSTVESVSGGCLSGLAALQRLLLSPAGWAG